jgi:hypothetical protein
VTVIPKIGLFLIYLFIKHFQALIVYSLYFYYLKNNSVAEVLSQLNQTPNQRALLRNQRSLTNNSNNSNNNNNNSNNAAAAANSALTLLNAAAAVAAVANNRPSHHSMLSGM